LSFKKQTKIGMEKNNGQKELDLFSLFREIFNSLYRLLKKIARFCGYLLRLSFRYYYLLLPFIFASIVYSYYTSRNNYWTYKGEMTLILNVGDVGLYEGIISSLNRYISDGDPAKLDDALQMPPEERGKICYFNVSFTEEDPQDSTAIRALVSISMIDPNAFPVIKNALIDYFERNEYLKSLNSARIASLKDQERVFEKDIAEIDSLQKIEYFQRLNEVEIKLERNLTYKTEKQIFFKDKVKIFDRKEEVSKKLNARPGVVSVMSEFPPSSVPSLPFRKKVKQDVAMGFLFFSLIAILLDKRKQIMDYLREK